MSAEERGWRKDAAIYRGARACVFVCARARSGARPRVRARVWIKLESARRAAEAERGEEKQMRVSKRSKICFFFTPLS